jgi:hypothetical protein
MNKDLECELSVHGCFYAAQLGIGIEDGDLANFYAMVALHTNNPDMCEGLEQLSRQSKKSAHRANQIRAGVDPCRNCRFFTPLYSGTQPSFGSIEGGGC